MATVCAERASILRAEISRDETGSYKPGLPLRAKPGDVIELCFMAAITPGMMADIDVAVRGDSVVLDSIRNVVPLTDGHPIRGVAELDAVLRAERIGQSIVDVVVLTADGSPKEVIAFVIEVK